MYSRPILTVSIGMKIRHKIAAMIALTALTSTSWARDVMIQTVPSGARIEIKNIGTTRISEGTVYRSPSEIDFRSRTEPYRLEISLPGYETATFVYDYRNTSSREDNFTIELKRLVETLPVAFMSEPSGAEILVDGRKIGITPITAQLEFKRASSSAPWIQKQVTIQKADYQTERFVVGRQNSSNVPIVRLDLIRKVRTFSVATTSDGQKLPGAAVTINGEAVIKDGEPLLTPATIDLEFTRENSNADWNTYELKAEIENQFEPISLTIENTSKDALTLDLPPVTEVYVTRYFPITEFSIRGPKLGVDESAPLGILNPRDLTRPYSDLRKITDFKRNSPILNAVNSYTVTPDGERVIYSVTMARESGNLYANLFMKDASAQSFAVQRLTQGTQFFEINPVVSSDPDSSYVVFQSNRLGRRDTWDISAMRVQGGRVLGGIQQITHEPRFNFSPSMVSENRPLYLIGYENFPSARPYVSSVRLDGSSYTVLPEEAESVSYTESGQIYLVRETIDPEVKQIFALDAESNQLSTVINNSLYAEANCFDPDVSPDGSRMLFVSDYARDEKDRPNNNIFILDFDTGNIQQITDNGSDDIRPTWSPTEPNVIYFMSNREGIYNIWRMVLVIE